MLPKPQPMAPAQETYAFDHAYWILAINTLKLEPREVARTPFPACTSARAAKLSNSWHLRLRIQRMFFVSGREVLRRADKQVVG